MTDMKRYDLQDATERDGCAYMAQDPTGEFVLSSDYDTLAAKLAEVEAERDAVNNSLEMQIAQFWAMKARAEAAEAALVAAYRLAVKDQAKRAYQWWDDDDAQELRDHMRHPTPTAGELMARIKERKADDQ